MARRIPFDDPQTLTYVRIAYVTTQVIVLGVYYYVAQQVRIVVLEGGLDWSTHATRAD